MPQLRLTRCYHFSAAHRLHTSALDDSTNRAVYGKCNNPFGHGHNYTVELSVQGETELATGRVVDVAALDALAREVIAEPFDHRDLNVEVAEFAGLVPTTENLAVVLAARLAARWPRSWTGRFEKLRVWETGRNIFEVSAPKERVWA